MGLGMGGLRWSFIKGGVGNGRWGKGLGRRGVLERVKWRKICG